MKHLPQIVIVGGGAGGLELAIRLSVRLQQQVAIVLVDKSTTHLWKPLLHEVAAGTLDAQAEEVNYWLLAHRHGFHFCLGNMTSLDRGHKKIGLAAIEAADGRELVPVRSLAYDVLVMAVGSVAHDFGVGGVDEYCFLLEDRGQAEAFQRFLGQQVLRLAYQKTQNRSDPPLTIVVIGGGATGVELAAELMTAVGQMVEVDRGVTASDFQVVLVESHERLLAPLDPRVSAWALQQLQQMQVSVQLNAMVARILPHAVYLQSGQVLPADMIVWAAGIKAPHFLSELGLASNQLNQLQVKSTLQTTQDESIFALGDCASCPQQVPSTFVPARAQAAYQQAHFLAQVIPQYLQHESLPVFVYRDRGSLVSLGQGTAVASLEAGVKRVIIPGKLARWAYFFLYKKHQFALHGGWRVLLLTVANLMSRGVKPRLKMH